MSERRGQRPSEALEVGCKFCAWCLDEALYVLDAIEGRKRAEQAEAEAELEKNRQLTREAMRTA